MKESESVMKAKRNGLLYDQIMDAVQTILRCEDELRMKSVDIDDYTDDTNPQRRIWTNLGYPRISAIIDQENSGIPSEDPCRYLRSLIDKSLDKSHNHILWQGCSILTRDNFGQFCITGRFDEDISRKIRVWNE